MIGHFLPYPFIPSSPDFHRRNLNGGGSGAEPSPQITRHLRRAIAIRIPSLPSSTKLDNGRETERAMDGARVS